jgi:DNA-binding MarR family transcriptional regulator
MAKSNLQLQGVVRGFANHRRIQMLGLLDEHPELSLLEVAGRLRINGKTASEHLRRLAIAGLVMKRPAGHEVRHKLTPRGNVVLKFLRTLE